MRWQSCLCPWICIFGMTNCQKARTTTRRTRGGQLLEAIDEVLGILADYVVRQHLAGARVVVSTGRAHNVVCVYISVRQISFQFSLNRFNERTFPPFADHPLHSSGQTRAVHRHKAHILSSRNPWSTWCWRSRELRGRCKYSSVERPSESEITTGV